MGVATLFECAVFAYETNRVQLFSEHHALFQSYPTSSIPKDTLVKEIVNDELIVGINDIKATSHDVCI